MRLLGRMARPCRPCRPRGPRQPLQRRSLATDTLSPTGTNAIPRTNRDTSPPTEKRAIPLASRDTSPSAGKDTTPPNSNSTISSTSTPASMNNIPTVDHAEVKRIAEGKDGEKVALIDVRRPDEVAATGRIPRSLHIPGTAPRLSLAHVWPRRRTGCCPDDDGRRRIPTTVWRRAARQAVSSDLLLSGRPACPISGRDGPVPRLPVRILSGQLGRVVRKVQLKIG